MVSAAAPTGGSPWLVGGGVTDADGVNHVAIWSAADPAGPWIRNAVAPVPGRDGPNETVLAFAPATGAGPVVSLGSRPSPNEGYPRPSTWFAAGPPGEPSWHEMLAVRELFGGPNVVALGAMSAGPHGYFIAGSWVGPGNQVVAAVWTSPDGRDWTRDDTDPAFDAGPGTTSYAYGVADGPSGVVLTGTTAVPTRSDPTREVGALWYSAAGARWVRLPPPSRTGRTLAGTVAAVGSGWLAGGSTGQQPQLWSIDAHLHVSATTLPAPTGATVDSLAVTATAALAGGVTPGGHPVLWMAPRHGDRVGRWRLLTAPPTRSAWSAARLAATSGHILLVLFDGGSSQVWQAALAG